MAAAKKLASLQAVDALKVALEHPDPRVRRAVCEGISNDAGFFRGLVGRSKSALTPAQVSAAFLPYFTRTLRDETAALWEIDEVLYAFSKARPEDIRAALPLITPWLKHEEWYLRESAFYAMQGLRGTIEPEELFMMAEVFAAEKHSKAQINYGDVFRDLFTRLKVKLSDEDLQTFAQSIGRQMTDPQIPRGMGRAAEHQCAFKAGMVFKHMDPRAHVMLQDDYVRYLQTWTPGFQHSGWMVTGSRWNLSMQTVLQSMGKEGKPLCLAMKGALEKLESGRLPMAPDSHKQIVATLKAAVAEWEKEFGVVAGRD